VSEEKPVSEEQPGEPGFVSETVPDFVPGPGAGSGPRRERPVPGDRFASCRFPEIGARLANGLQVIVVPRPRLPIFSATMLLPAGVAREEAGEEGLAALTAGLVTLGTERRDAVRLAEDVDALGASLGVACDYDFLFAGVSALARDRAEILEILAESLTRPAFREEELERRRNDTLSVLERREDDAVSLVRNRFLGRVYGPHPYHHPREGRRESVARFRREDLLTFYRRHYGPANATLALVGDIDPAEILPLVEALFSPWAAGPAPPAEPSMPPPSGAVTFDRIHKAGRTQAVLRLGNRALCRNSRDYVPAVVLNYILGGSGPSCRLGRALREERGLAYEVHSNLHPRREPGYFFASAHTGLENLDEALATMQAEIRRVLEDGVDEEELALARRFFTGSLPLALETNDQLATYVLSREFYGLGEEYWLHDIERIESLTLQEVNDVARRVIRPESFAIVCLADFRRLGRHETQPESPGGPGGPDGRAAADGPARLLGSGQRRRPGPAASR